MPDQAIIINWLLAYKYFILFPIVAIEGPLVTMAIGFLVSLSLFNPYIALPIIIAGDVTSDVVYYFIGYFSHRFKWAYWISEKIGLAKRKERINNSFQKHGGKILLFGKLTHALGAVFLIGAGYAKMPLIKFIWYNIVGTAIKSSALLYIGYLAGTAYRTYHIYFEYGTLVLTVGSLALIGLFYYFFHKITGIKTEPDLDIDRGESK